jgi:hypothetical protein
MGPGKDSPGPSGSPCLCFFFPDSTGLQVWPGLCQKLATTDPVSCLDPNSLGKPGDPGRGLKAVFRPYLQSGRVRKNEPNLSRGRAIGIDRHCLEKTNPVPRASHLSKMTNPILSRPSSKGRTQFRPPGHPDLDLPIDQYEANPRSPTREKTKPIARTLPARRQTGVPSDGSERCRSVRAL